MKRTNERDQILFKENYNKNKYLGGARRFSDLSLKNLLKLLELDFTTTDESQNDGPTIYDIIIKLRNINSERLTFQGYSIAEDRHDFRVTVDTILLTYPTREEIEFITKNTDWIKTSDDCIISDDELYLWWD